MSPIFNLFKVNRSGWLYLIKNGDLYKIGITKNIEQRMLQLKPDYVVSKIYSTKFKQLEREFHKRYKKVRIPQTEYFRLDQIQIREIKLRMSKFYYPHIITFSIFLNSIYLLFGLFLLVFLIISLNINDLENVLFISLLWMERISLGLSFISFFIESQKYLSLFNEIKFRSSRFCILLIASFFFRFVSRAIF